MKATLLVALSIDVMTYLPWRSFRLLFGKFFFNTEKASNLDCVDSSNIAHI